MSSLCKDRARQNREAALGHKRLDYFTSLMPLDSFFLFVATVFFSDMKITYKFITTNQNLLLFVLKCRHPTRRKLDGGVSRALPEYD